MRSKDNSTALKAVTELNANGWLVDGSLHKKAFMNANLSNSELFYASLENCWFTRANFQNAILFESNLKGAHFEEADFSNADLAGADLYASHMQDAIIVNSKLHKANLEHSGLLDEQLAKAETLKGAIMPNGSIYNGCYRLQEEIDAFITRYGEFKTSKEWATYYGVSVDEYDAGQKWADEHPEFFGGINLYTTADVN